MIDNFIAGAHALRYLIVAIAVLFAIGAFLTWEAER